MPHPGWTAPDDFFFGDKDILQQDIMGAGASHADGVPCIDYRDTFGCEGNREMQDLRTLGGLVVDAGNEQVGAR